MIILEKPTTRRQQEFLAAVKRSKRFYGSWVIAPHTSAAFKACLQGTRGEAHLSYWVLTENHALAGVINVNEIVRGAFCSGYLGLLCVHSTQWQRVYEPRLGNGPQECLSGAWAAPC